MNLNLFGFGTQRDRKWIIVDLGVTFGDLTTPGVDLIMPDPAFIADQREDLLGIIATHGHEDHIGAIARLWPMLKCPVYATPFTANLIENKLAELGLLDEVPLHVVDLGARFDLGPFDIEYITLTHSILEPNALAIRTPLGTVLHTGDWKIDPEPLLGDLTNENRLREIGEDGVLAIICDSTNVFVPGTAGSEGAVRESLIELVASLKGRVAITTFASNFARLTSAIEAARANDRHVCLVGRSMLRITEAARETGYITDFSGFVTEEEAGFLPKDNVLYLCTGSQGEGRAALARIASGDHQHVTLSEGDTVIFSSRIIPGNERGIYALQNQLIERGVDVIDADDHFVHVSGHPCRDDLATMYQWLKPQVAIPVHGELRHLREHVKFAKKCQVPEVVMARNGEMVRIGPGKAQIVDEVPSGRLHLDGEFLVSDYDPALKDRRKIAYAGVLVVTVTLDDEGQVLEDPRVLALGMPNEKGMSGRSLQEVLEADVDGTLETMSPRQRRSDGDIEQACRRALRQRMRNSWQKRPQIEVQVIRLEAV
ncbi:MAG: ribonuclease J [Alphaproteobacteria bacterium]|nr:MAG: ribonuclease J [Alphaproteobacteria bacterium]